LEEYFTLIKVFLTSVTESKKSIEYINNKIIVVIDANIYNDLIINKELINELCT
jgi:hypothetical protein